MEATALGNVLVQARACGVVPATLEATRAAVAADPAIRHVTPTRPGAPA